MCRKQDPELPKEQNPFVYNYTSHFYAQFVENDQIEWTLLHFIGLDINK